MGKATSHSTCAGHEPERGGRKGEKGGREEDDDETMVV
jgi:hypothetical protein